MRLFRSSLTVLIIFLGFGILFFLIQKEFIVVRFNFLEKCSPLVINDAIQKPLTFYFSDGTRSYDQQQTMLWRRGCAAENVRLLLESWFYIALSERFIQFSVMIQHVFCPTDQQVVYVSFDRSPLGKEWSIRKKICCIESLLKTIACSGAPVKYINFLVNHESFADEHLDFSYPWPIDGFLSNSLSE